MKKILRKIFKHTIGKILKKKYLQFVKNNKNIPSFLRTPFVINIYMQTMFTYKTDLENFRKEDYWDTTLNILNRESDDCDGFAQVAKDLLLPKYNPRILLVYVSNGKDQKAHAVCLFQDKTGLYYYMDNIGYRRQHFYRVGNAAFDIVNRVYGEEYSLSSFKLM